MDEATPSQQWFTDNALLVVSSGAGIYAPKEMYESLSAMGRIVDLARGDNLILMHGPESEHYWDASINLEDATFIKPGGFEYGIIAIEGDWFIFPLPVPDFVEWEEIYG